MGEAGIILTFVTGICTAVVFQDFLRLRNHNEFPANQLLSNEFECTAALFASHFGFRQINNDLFYREVLCQFLNGSFFLTRMGRDSKGLLGGFLSFVVLAVLSFVEEVQLVFIQNIGLLLAGLAILCPLGIGKDLIHMLQLSLQFCVFLLQGFYRLSQRANKLCYFRGSICNFVSVKPSST